jgi:archaellum biogenesis ATPase FlaH
MTTEYTANLQKLFLEMILHDAQNYIRVQNIYNSENFDRSLKDASEFIKTHSIDHGSLPTAEQVKAVTGVDLKPIPEANESHNEWFMQEFEQFTRRQELERAILKSADLLEKGEYDPVEKLIKDAVQISLTKDMGTDYFEDPRARLMKLKDNNGQISTGWPALDRKLFGGMNKGELNIFAGGSGSGKSLFMQNLAVNWTTQGLSGVYLTLELSEGLSAMRIDSMLTNVSTKEIFKDIDTVEMKVRMVGKKSGSLQIKYMPAQSNVNDIRAYLKELQIKNNKSLDFLLIDYLDLIMPVSAKVSPNDLFVKDKYVSEELRNLAKELDCVFVTASQLNRGAVEEIEFDHSHIAGGLSKINTADNVFGIFTSRAMRERGRYQLQLMKTRSSSGVGQKIDLEFDIESLRIRDLGEDENQQRPQGNIMDQIKNKSGIIENNDPEVGKITANVNSNKLKNMLAGLKTNE